MGINEVYSDMEDYQARLAAMNDAWIRISKQRDDAVARFERADAAVVQLQQERTNLCIAKIKVAQERDNLQWQQDRLFELLDHLDGLDSRIGHEEIRAIFDKPAVVAAQVEEDFDKRVGDVLRRVRTAIDKSWQEWCEIEAGR